MVNIGVIGCGAWGANLVRNFYENPEANLLYCCDSNPEILRDIAQKYPEVNTASNVEEVLDNKDIQAVVIATPLATHFQIAKKALEARKHVYIEKPITSCSKEAKELINTAQRVGRHLMVGHLLKYHPAVVKLKETIRSKELGEVYYIYSQRVNLGKIRKHENALWSFAPHDISAILYLLEEEPETVNAVGESYLQKGIEDVVFVTLHFKDRKIAHIQLSWLDPHKIRKVTIVGSKKMAVFDDMETTEKIKIYDKGAILPGQFLSYAETITLREGDIYIPYLKMEEPLKIECQHFLDCIQKNKNPLTDGEDGLRVVRVLEAAQESLKNQGRSVRLKE